MTTPEQSGSAAALAAERMPAAVADTRPTGRRAQPPHIAGPRRGRRRGAGGLALEGRTSTAYALRDDARRTLGYLRRIVGQSHIPDHATVAIDSDRITIEWEDR